MCTTKRHSSNQRPNVQHHQLQPSNLDERVSCCFWCICTWTCHQKKFLIVNKTRLRTKVKTANGSIGTTDENKGYVKGPNSKKKKVSSKVESETPNLITDGKMARCKRENFLPITVPGRSSEARLTSSAEDSAEKTKELTQMNRKRPERSKEFTDTCGNQDQNPQEVTAMVLEIALDQKFSHHQH